MTITDKAVRRSLSLPPQVARRVQDLAKRRKASASRVLVDLIESGLEAQELEKERFLDLADRFAAASDARERARLKAELARMTFGE